MNNYLFSTVTLVLSLQSILVFAQAPSFGQLSYAFVVTSCSSGTSIGTVAVTSTGSATVTYSIDNAAITVNAQTGALSLASTITGSVSFNVKATSSAGTTSVPVYVGGNCNTGSSNSNYNNYNSNYFPYYQNNGQQQFCYNGSCFTYNSNNYNSNSYSSSSSSSSTSGSTSFTTSTCTSGTSVGTVSGGTSYQITNNSNFYITSAGQIYLANALSAGTYTLTVQLNNSNGSASSTQSITVTVSCNGTSSTSSSSSSTSSSTSCCVYGVCFTCGAG